MFTFVLFLLLSGLCFILYLYFTNKIALLRKQIMLLRNQNDELKNKLNKLIEARIIEKNIDSSNILLLENEEFDVENKE